MQYQLISVRLSVKVKAGMVGLIHNRSLTLLDGHYDESAAVTLMSSDTEQVSGSTNMVWEIWAIFIEILVGMVLLSKQLGWACLMPFFFVVRKGPPSPQVLETNNAMIAANIAHNSCVKNQC